MMVIREPLPADVTVTAAELGGVPTAEVTVDGIDPRHVVLYFHGGVYVLGTASQAYSPVLDEAAAALDRAGRLLSSYLASSERVSA